MKFLLASLIALTPVSASAEDVIGWETTSKTCYRETYREEYVPGTRKDPGFIRTYNELIEVPCRDDHADSDEEQHRHRLLADIPRRFCVPVAQSLATQPNIVRQIPGATTGSNPLTQVGPQESAAAACLLNSMETPIRVL